MKKSRVFCKIIVFIYIRIVKVFVFCLFFVFFLLMFHCHLAILTWYHVLISARCLEYFLMKQKHGIQAQVTGIKKSIKYGGVMALENSKVIRS